MSDIENYLNEEEEAFLLLTTEEEKKHFEEIIKTDRENDGIVSKKCPRLTVSYYLLKYRDANLDFAKYIKDTENEMAVLRSIISQKGNSVLKESGFKRRNRQLAEETDHERKMGRKRNFRYAVILLIIVFMFLALNYLK